MPEKTVPRQTSPAGTGHTEHAPAKTEAERQQQGNQLLRLLALDEHDLDVISAHLQDAFVRRADLHYFPAERRFVLAAQRFDWERDAKAAPQRRLTALHFEQVRAVRHRHLGQAPDALHTLLAIYFVENEKPSGAILLEFAGGAAILLDVECVEAQLKDLGPVWNVEARPSHGQVEGDDAGKA
ncbi:DUF2948 family protein [Pseudochelatococcus contaminans]|uniref:DUF2948 family protein n=1 Tax=Pseudochelatococcus contaminans TaxID=1538103 RepID=A0A7W6EEM1_9HYPH|nr:DUF2948 family protein [Pseudochelatococcus contaminans]MBB3808294.1 hypothetical protein [Pseudochelatococcus contaminans]